MLKLTTFVHKEKIIMRKKGEYVYTFVPDFITAKWSDDDSLIRIIGQETLSVRTEDYRETFQEGYIYSLSIQ